MLNLDHQHYMRLAMRQAVRAGELGEVPAGCVIVRIKPETGTTEIIGRAHNQVEMLKDPTAHAEMIAITQAAAAIGDWRLTDTILYVTKEPCAMCAGAIVLGRIPIVVYGVPDPVRGAQSSMKIFTHPGLNHHCEIVGDVLADECRDLLRDFFKARRES